jgi:hypothetical protein
MDTPVNAENQARNRLRRQADSRSASRIPCRATKRKQTEEAMLETVSELERFKQLLVGRYQQMIELERDINDLRHSIDHQEEHRTPTSENIKKSHMRESRATE